MLKFTNLNHSDQSQDNYGTVLYENASDDVTFLDLEIDRGITCFVGFAELLNTCYPNLQHLKVVQNYSFAFEKDDQCQIQDFYTMIKNLKIQTLQFDDYQSKCFNDFNIDSTFNVMAPDTSLVFTFRGQKNKTYNSTLASPEILTTYINTTIHKYTYDTKTIILRFGIVSEDFDLLKFTPVSLEEDECEQ